MMFKFISGSCSKTLAICFNTPFDSGLIWSEPELNKMPVVENVPSLNNLLRRSCPPSATFKFEINKCSLPSLKLVSSNFNAFKGASLPIILGISTYFFSFTHNL